MPTELPESSPVFSALSPVKIADYSGVAQSHSMQIRLSVTHPHHSRWLSAGSAREMRASARFVRSQWAWCVRITRLFDKIRSTHTTHVKMPRQLAAPPDNGKKSCMRWMCIEMLRALWLPAVRKNTFSSRVWPHQLFSATGFDEMSNISHALS